MRKTEMSYVKMRKILVKDMNDVLVCTLCNGYLIDATILTECHHTFCRGCILRYFENCKAACPSCNCVYKKKNQVVFRADPQTQAIVYKVVPGLYSKEMQRREDFYRSTGVRASSSCSDDSVFERERDMINDEDSLSSSYVGEKSQFFGPEDSISLSLEYYQYHLDKTSPDSNKTKTKQVDANPAVLQDKSASVLNNNNSDAVGDRHKQRDAQSDKEKSDPECKSDKRFLQCPAAVSMTHLQKFVRMKFALTQDHKVDIIYQGEVLPSHFSLMDVAYTFNWKKVTPMRFFYRIFTPLKIQPIKIVNTTLSTGGKQLQVVSSIKNNDPPPPPPPPPVKPSPPPSTPPKSEVKEETVEDCNQEKERLLANLQLQSKSKVQSSDNVPEKGGQQPPVQDCVFNYEEQDKEEIKRFAEIRDREWAMQKKLDESREKDKDDEYHHFSKKRKKNKHSKNDSTYKKRKLHAEITNKEEDLKLKVKLTQHNGHKHKHHKSSSQNQVEASSKEKLLQMRQIRHKHVVSEDKNIQTIPSGSVSKETSTETPPSDVKVEENNQIEKVEIQVVKPIEIVSVSEEIKSTNGVKNGDEKKIVPEVKTIVPEVKKPEVKKPIEVKKLVEVNPTKTLRSDFPSKTTMNKEWGNRVPTVQIERNEQTEQQAKKTFLKSYQAYAEKYQKSLEKAQQIKAADKILLNRPSNLERKIANLQQRCTIEAKNPPPKPEGKVPEKKPPVVEKPKPPTHYPPGFTVSKIESGAKRKLEVEDNRQEKRPSLEITLINPPTTEVKASTPVPNKPSTPTPAKRPPPATIPLDRIKKSFTFKGGLSIIPKTAPEKCDNIGALDLSAKPSTTKEPETPPTPSTSTKPVNGFATSTPKEGKTVVNMSNLQMLSKVATEHHSLNKNPKPKPQIPNLQTLRIPSPNQRIPPKLQMIDKTHFRMMSPQIRNLRPNQNQNIRNIPNPSLLVRQQQNRLNSMAPAVRENNNGEAAKVVTTSEPVAKAAEAKPSEAKEVTV